MYNTSGALRINTDSFSLFDLISCNNQPNIHHTVMKRKVGQDTVNYDTTNNNTTNFYYQKALKPIDNAPGWVSTTTYAVNANVSYQGTFYRSLQNNNTGKQPNLHITLWVLMAKQEEQLLLATRGWFTHVNRDFLRKIRAYFDRMNDHVMNQSCYQHVKEIMPGCITGNYANFSPVNGTTEYFFPNDPRNTYLRTPHESMTQVHKYKPYLRSDFQQPVCYSPAMTQGYTGTRNATGATAFYVNTTNANLTGTSTRTNFTPNGAIRACVQFGNKTSCVQIVLLIQVLCSFVKLRIVVGKSCICL
jgi:hypothetical protein